MQTNTSGFKPVGARVLVLPTVVEEKSEGGIIINIGNDLKREELAQINGVVVALGNTCYHDQPEAWCKLGDTIMFGKYSGLFYTGDDEKKYRIINDLDVVSVRDKEAV